MWRAGAYKSQSTADATTPVAITAGSYNFSQIAGGNQFTLGLLTNGGWDAR